MSNTQYKCYGGQSANDPETGSYIEIELICTEDLRDLWSLVASLLKGREKKGDECYPK